MLKKLSLSIAAQFIPRFLRTYDKQHLSILIYHRVLPESDLMRPDEPTVEQFDWQMRLLRTHFQPLALLDALQRLEAGTLPNRAICITFDDGYADNEQHALPILQKYSIPATVFVSTGFLNGGRMWNDSVIEALRNFRGEKLDLNGLDLGSYSMQSTGQRLHAVSSIIDNIKHLDPDIRTALVHEVESRSEKLPLDLMLTDDQVRSLSRHGITIGAHTVNHPILSSVSAEVARREIGESKVYLEQVLQREIEVFAYPNGKPSLDYRVEHRNMVQELGFKAAVSTHWGVSSSQSDIFQLPRFTPWDRDELKFGLRLLAGYRQLDPLIPAAI